MEEKTGLLTVTVTNPSTYQDKDYKLYFDGELRKDDSLEAGMQGTYTFEFTWRGDGTVAASIIWAGGSDSQEVTLVENSVVGATFTLT